MSFWSIILFQLIFRLAKTKRKFAMKQSLLTTLLILFALGLQAQYSTQGFSFQGYASDPEGKALGSVAITVKYTLYSGTNTNLTYAEEQNVTTDAYGVFTALVGKGTSIGAETKTPFAALNLNLYAYKLKVEVKKTAGGSYTTLSDELLNAVPYARSAENGVPVGTIVAFGGPISGIPAGWALCDGALRDGNQDEWKALFAAIGTSWGTTGGANFNLPDTRGFFLRGVDGGAGRDEDRSTRFADKGGNTGDNVGTIQGDQTRSHNHGGGTTSASGIHDHGLGRNGARRTGNGFYGILQIDGQNTLNSADADGSFNQPNLDRIHEFPTANDAAHGEHSHTFTTNNAGGAETRAENVAVYYIIKK
jgi:microcystin-dependent protein